MGASMSMEETYMIAMIVLAGVAGVLLITLIVTCCCCCRYMRKLKGGGSGTRFAKTNYYSKSPKEHVRSSAYEGWGVTPTRGAASRSCGCPNDGADAGGCATCNMYAASAYDWMSPANQGGVAMGPSSNVYGGSASPYVAGPVAQTRAVSNEYGRVRLNPPSAICNKPATTQGGSCAPGVGNCAFNMSPSQNVYGSSQNASSSGGAQFVLESCPKPF
jgi:hypothetical protein